MEPFNVAVGIAAIVFGCITFYMRSTSPSRFAKLKAMRARFGDRLGLLVHTVAYSLVPIAFGLVALVLGLSGRSIFD